MPKQTFLNLNKAKQERIISGAISVFSEKAYDHVTVKDIVIASKIPRGSFYQYFEDIYDLFMHIIEYAQTIKLNYLEPILSRVGHESFLELYLELFEAGLNFAKENYDLYQVGAHLFLSQSPVLIEHMRTLDAYGIQYLSTLLKQDQAAGFIKEDVDVVMIAKVLYHLNARDLIFELYKGTSHDSIMTMVKNILDIIKYGAYKEDINA